MKYTLKKILEKPLLYSKNNIVTDINGELIKLTGYTKEEIIGKSLTEISNMLRIASQVYLGNIESEYSCYMFTKEYEPREVTISCRNLKTDNEKNYFFKEKPNFRIDEFKYLEQVHKDNEISVAIYSFPDLILLRANQKYLDFLDYPYNKKENSIGKSLKEMLTGYVDSNAEKLFINIIETGTSYYAKEAKYDCLKSGVTYWDTSLVPIYIEGEAKLIIQISSDVTEKVVNRKLAEEKTKQLEVIIQNISDELIIVDENGQYTMTNKAFRNHFSISASELITPEIIMKKVECYDINGKLIPFKNLPSQRIARGEKFLQYREDIKNKNGRGSPGSRHFRKY